MVPKLPGEGTLLDGFEELVEGGEVGLVGRTLASDLICALHKSAPQLPRWEDYGSFFDLLNIERRLSNSPQLALKVLLNKIHPEIGGDILPIETIGNRNARHRPSHV